MTPRRTAHARVRALASDRNPILLTCLIPILLTCLILLMANLSAIDPAGIFVAASASGHPQMPQRSRLASFQPLIHFPNRQRQERTIQNIQPPQVETHAK